ncbi:hypothetical protein LEMLEM_LOCUS11404 [Lemmus lemmus]
MGNQLLIQLETHAMRGSPSLPLPGGPGTRGWMAQRSRREPNTKEKGGGGSGRGGGGGRRRRRRRRRRGEEGEEGEGEEEGGLIQGISI